MKQVKAQVMSRDDSSGGWVPVAGGGMSVVALQRISTDTEDGSEIDYKITGHRQTDGFVSVSRSAQQLTLISYINLCCHRHRHYINCFWKLTFLLLVHVFMCIIVS